MGLVGEGAQELVGESCFGGGVLFDRLCEDALGVYECEDEAVVVLVEVVWVVDGGVGGFECARGDGAELREGFLVLEGEVFLVEGQGGVEGCLSLIDFELGLVRGEYFLLKQGEGMEGGL